MDKEQIWRRVCDVWEIEAKTVTGLKNTVDANTVADAVKMLAERRGKVVTVGVGTSAAAARKIAHTLSCIEIPAFFLSPGDGVHGALGVVQKGDVVIAISKGGDTEEIAKILPAVKAKGVNLIGVTENENSVLGSAADICLKIKVEKEACPFNMLATASAMAVIAVFDAMAIALMEVTGYTRDKFAIIHPGGAVGERLLKGKK
ncbi:MAG: KpsF/GutQ family sugar-phosphate isomerase [Bacillota bacterium]